MHALTAPLQELLDEAVRAERLDQLDAAAMGVAQGQRGEALLRVLG